MEGRGGEKEREREEGGREGGRVREKPESREKTNCKQGNKIEIIKH